jgi:UDP-N-acetylglucosamine/UDP-N-acetylgalactosamine 4-epimerase
MTAEQAVGKVYNVACGERVALNGLLDELQVLTGHEIEARYEAPRPGDIRHSLADVTRAQAELGYSPRVNLHEGLRLSVAHYEEEPAVQLAWS